MTNADLQRYTLKGAWCFPPITYDNNNWIIACMWQSWAKTRAAGSWDLTGNWTSGGSRCFGRKAPLWRGGQGWGRKESYGHCPRAATGTSGVQSPPTSSCTWPCPATHPHLPTSRPISQLLRRRPTQMTTSEVVIAQGRLWGFSLLNVCQPKPDFLLNRISTMTSSNSRMALHPLLHSSFTFLS